MSPPILTNLPEGLPATTSNIPALKQWLVDYYAASVFKTCEHQPQLMIKCEPLELLVDPDEKVTAVHKPDLVPIHWQEQLPGLRTESANQSLGKS